MSAKSENNVCVSFGPEQLLVQPLAEGRTCPRRADVMT